MYEDMFASMSECVRARVNLFNVRGYKRKCADKDSQITAKET